MLSRSKWLRCSVLAVASVAVLALPSAAPAHETGDHAPVTANCPGGDELSNAICFALRGVEYSVRHGGTVGAAQELRTETEGNATTYQNQTVANVGAFRSAIELAVPVFAQAVDDGIVNGVNVSDLYGAGLIVAIDDSLGTTPPPPCPIANVNPGILQNTVQALKVFFCAQWAAIVPALPSANAAPLIAHIGLLDDAVGAIEQPLRNALLAFEGALQSASTTLGNATSAATRALGANQVLDTFYAAQCVRKGDYGPFTRPTPCPL